MINKSKLIFDIGLHKGEDTGFYLKQGYTVIAVEANPVLADYCANKFVTEIKSGKLIILNVGISDKEGNMPFYINHASSEWSSFDESIGTRNNTPKSIFEKYGIPYYLKIDIEGFDYHCLNDIPENGEKPQYVSCEATDIWLLEILKQKGYKKFKLINQANNFKPMNIKNEIKWYTNTCQKIKISINYQLSKIITPKYIFGGSGPFGENTKGSWKTYDEIKNDFNRFHNGNLMKPISNYGAWWDFHATV
jgi:FkbM family methyltransferase